MRAGVIRLVVSSAAVLFLIPPGTASATFPGVNGKILISGDNVYTVDFETGKFTELTDTRALDYNASFSPSGRKIVFSRYSLRTGREHLWIMLSDGTKQRPVTTRRSASNPAFAPDGQTLIFSSGHGRMVTMNRDGSNRTILSRGTAPSYSPDGSRIVFQRTGSRQYPRLFTMASDGTDVKPLTLDGASARYASYSPDGERIILDYYNPDTREDGIFTIKPDGSALTEIPLSPPTPEFYVQQPVFSPDGTQIAFVHIDYDWLGESCACFFLATMAADGTDMEHTVLWGNTPDWGPQPPA